LIKIWSGDALLLTCDAVAPVMLLLLLSSVAAAAAAAAPVMLQLQSFDL
jgi:hypothetical protein